ncbi:MAG TPA: amidohydrolase, partial [Aestuariivirgaceae bacterium]|nr:amidohydrolase [Aestuariivirgaceae bacterium]
MIDADLIERAVEVRRHLHRHPELSNAEVETQAFIRSELMQMGLTEPSRAAGTGLVVDVVGTAGPSNRKVAVRADIDALPITEDSEFAFSSSRPGVMHACGHDAHTAMVLAAAAGLYRSRSKFRGTVRLIFQPAEEAEPLGGRRIVEEGLLDDVDAAIGIHVDPYLETGKIAVASGSYTLAADGFDIEVRGIAAHAAKPHEGVDGIAIGCAIVTEIQKIVSRETDALAPLIISVTSFSGGGSYNIIADRVHIKGTVRSGNDKVRAMAHARLEEIVSNMARLHRGQANLYLIKGEPPVENDAEMVAFVEAAARQVCG